MRTVDEIIADKIAALQRHDFDAAADFHKEQQLALNQCPKCIDKDREIAELKFRIIRLQEQEMKLLFNSKP